MQAAWNHRGQQNLGLAACMLPALRKIYGRDSLALNEAVQRTLKPFNTQPYMSGPLIGALVKVEELGEAEGFTPERIDRFRMSMMTGFAALGDAFFWNALLPAASIVSMFWAVKLNLLGLFIFLIVYNAVHLALRLRGFAEGYRRGLGVVAWVNNWRLPVLAMRLRLVSAGALGVLAVWILNYGLGVNWSRMEFWGAGLVAGPGIWLAARLMRRNWPVESLIYSLLAAVVVWTHLV